LNVFHKGSCVGNLTKCHITVLGGEALGRSLGLYELVRVGSDGGITRKRETQITMLAPPSHIRPLAMLGCSRKIFNRCQTHADDVLLDFSVPRMRSQINFYSINYPVSSVLL
jgi:hypothetical protein